MYLSKGDAVSVIAPAAQLRSVDQELVARAVGLLNSWGLRVKIRIDNRHHFYLAGSDDIRAQHLTDALMDSESKAIFCARGGYGSSRLLSSLASLSITPDEKIIVGYSDLTSLHMACRRLWPRIELIHGPNVITKQLLDDSENGEKNRASLHRALFTNDGVEEKVDFLVTGRASGQLTGGCMSLITSTIGTPFAAETSGSILFLEDTGEPPYRIDRMITQMRLAGLFENVAGVVFGVMQNCRDPYNDLRDVLTDLFSNYSFPVAYGLRSGHGDVNLSLRLGWSAVLDSDSGNFFLRPPSSY